jgi:type II secretory pathway predicted ATPase ExeA
MRLLTNCDMDTKTPFALVLLRQPSLRQRLRLGTFAALDQRCPSSRGWERTLRELDAGPIWP